MCPRDPIDIGEAARRIGVTPAALRLYEAKGLIRSERSANGYRRYSPETMRTARQVRRARRAGLSIRQIAEAIQQEPGALRALLRRHLAFLEKEHRKYLRLKRHLARWLESESAGSRALPLVAVTQLAGLLSSAFVV